MKYTFLVWCWLCVTVAGHARVGKLRFVWRENPSTTAVIGWCQESGSAPTLYFSESDGGNELTKYGNTVQPQRKLTSMGMLTYFARLSNLKPNTTYYFQIKDSEGHMPKRYYFRTAPNGANQPLSIVAGGDSRNNKEARVNANKLVAKLRPHVVFFNGDFTESCTDEEWKNWLDDWQHSITADGQLIPILVSRGNHELNNEVLEQLFDVPNMQLYYGITFGDNLLRAITLNSLTPQGGEQADWLAADLKLFERTTWKMVQYHFPIRPHNAQKQEQLVQQEHWAPLFYRFGVQLCLESDSHVAKTTWPLKPSSGPNSAEGFERDDIKGTTFIGEGCWGAPLRRNDDDKSWTRASGSFNHFDWIWIDRSRMDIRIVKTDNQASVAALSLDNLFAMPKGIDIWNQNGKGATITIRAERNAPSIEDEQPLAVATKTGQVEVNQLSATSQGTDIVVRWSTVSEGAGSKFELQRSVDGEPFSKVSEVAGKSATSANYAVLDKGCLSAYSGKFIAYRLKFIPASGQSVFYELPNEDQTTAGTASQIVNLAAGEQIEVKYRLDAAGDVALSLYGTGVRRMRHIELKQQAAGAFMKNMDPADLPRGRYFLIVKQGAKILLRQQVIVE